MNRNNDTKENTAERHRLAEERIAERPGCFDVGEQATAMETSRLVHELQVHQIELEMQNEELQHTRAAVEEGLARYTDLYEFAPVGYMTLGRNGEILQVNLTGAGQLGMERSRLVGKIIGLFVAPETRAAFDAFLVKVFDCENKETCEVVMYPEGKPPLAVSLTGTAVCNDEMCRIVTTDITLQKQAEHERELMRLQLAQSQKMEAIGTFAGGIAHDFNNLLSGIQGGLSVMDLDLGEAHRHHLHIQEMESMVERGAALAKQLLGFARLGKYDVKPVDLARAVEKTTLLFGRTHRDISILIDIVPGLQAVLMDDVQLEQVLLNLLINAGQAMPTGGRISLFAKTTDLAAEKVAPHGVQPGRFVQLEVADTGIGMDAATQARIFEPFFTTKGLGKGTGLGLASVYGILKNHGGFVTVRSTPGNGAVFTLFLPVTDLPITVEKAEKTSIKPGRGTVLLVDDEELILKVYADLLKRIGYDVLSARCGKEAIELLQLHKDTICLVLLDMIMPDMNGRETYAALRKIVPDIKVLLSSGYSSSGQAEEILAMGCNGFIQKPFKLAALSEKIKEIL